MLLEKTKFEFLEILVLVALFKVTSILRSQNDTLQQKQFSSLFVFIFALGKLVEQLQLPTRKLKAVFDFLLLPFRVELEKNAKQMNSFFGFSKKSSFSQNSEQKETFVGIICSAKQILSRA